MRNKVMLRPFLDVLKAKKICKHSVKRFPFLIHYVPDRYKAQRMWDKIILEKGEISMFTSGRYKYQNMSDKSVANYAHALVFVLDRYKTQNMCDKAVSTYLSTIYLWLIKTHEMFDIAVDTICIRSSSWLIYDSRIVWYYF